MVARWIAAGWLVAAAAGCAAPSGGGERASAAADVARDAAELGSVGAPPVALQCARVLTVDDEDRIFSPGTLLLRDGRIEYVGAAIETPPGYHEIDHRDGWAFPGLVDLHTHIHTGAWGSRDGYLGDDHPILRPVNPELSTGSSLRPSNPLVRLACAGGVTTVFGIPGSGIAMSGFGVLYKTKTNATFDEAVLASPGGLKVAQTHNPERYRAATGDLGSTRAGMSWTLEDLNDRAVAALEQGRFDPALENLKKVHSGELPVLIHCAAAQGVANTVRMWKGAYDTRCVVSHGSFTGYRVADWVAEQGVPVNHGPRTLDYFSSRSGAIVPTSRIYSEAGANFSLNTDSPIFPSEELFLQGTTTARQGVDSYAALRALTIHPARSFGIDDRVGSLEVGKDADIVISTGSLLDPREHVELVVIDGSVQYAREKDGQWF